MTPVRHYPIEYAAGLATADIESQSLRPAPYAPRRSEFRHLRRARIIDRAMLTAALVIGGVGVLFMIAGTVLTVINAMGVR